MLCATAAAADVPLTAVAGPEEVKSSPRRSPYVSFEWDEQGRRADYAYVSARLNRAHGLVLADYAHDGSLQFGRWHSLQYT